MVTETEFLDGEIEILRQVFQTDSQILILISNSTSDYKTLKFHKHLIFMQMHEYVKLCKIRFMQILNILKVEASSTYC